MAEEPTPEADATLSSSRERLEVPPPQEKSSIGRVRRNSDFILISQQSYHRDGISVMAICSKRWPNQAFKQNIDAKTRSFLKNRSRDIFLDSLSIP